MNFLAMTIDDEMLQMMNDAYQCLNENINKSCENEWLESTRIMNDVNEYKKLIEDAKILLYSGCIDFTKLSTTVKLYNLKVKNRWSDSSFGQMLKLQKEMFPKENTLPYSAYAAKSS